MLSESFAVDMCFLLVPTLFPEFTLYKIYTDLCPWLHFHTQMFKTLKFSHILKCIASHDLAIVLLFFFCTFPDFKISLHCLTIQELTTHLHVIKIRNNCAISKLSVGIYAHSQFWLTVTYVGFALYLCHICLWSCIFVCLQAKPCQLIKGILKPPYLFFMLLQTFSGDSWFVGLFNLMLWTQISWAKDNDSWHKYPVFFTLLKGN